MPATCCKRSPSRGKTLLTNGNDPWLPTQVCGLLTLALGVLLFAGILQLLVVRRAFDFESYFFDLAGASVAAGRVRARTAKCRDRGR